MKAMIFAAGLGTRLKPFTDNHPKALAEVNGKTLLEHSILYLQRYGIYDIVVNAHHFANQIHDTLSDNAGFGSSVVISDEADLLETGGGLLYALPHFEQEEAFVVMNVDVLTNLNLTELIHHHTTANAIGTLAVMNRNSSRKLLFDKKMTLCGWRHEQTGAVREAGDITDARPFAFSGIQVLSPHIFDGAPFIGKFSLIDLYLHQAQTKTIRGYDHSGNLFIDVGKPGSIEQAAYLFS